MPIDSAVSQGRPRSRTYRAGRYALLLLLLTLVYVIAGKLGLALATVHPSVSAIWPASGIATGALALFGPRLWPGVWIGAFLVNYSLTRDLDSSLGIACGNTAASLAGAWFLAHFGGARAFRESDGLVGFLTGSGLLASGIAATVGTASLAWMGSLASGHLPTVWFTWWVGDAVSVWTLVPVLVLGKESLESLFAHRIPFRPWRLAEFLGVTLILLFGSLVTFGGILPGAYSVLPTGFANLPAFFWLALRFRPLGISMGLFVHFAIAVWGTSQGFGSYARMPEGYLLLQLYMATRVFFFQLLAVLTIVRQRAIEDLHVSQQRIHDIIGSVPGVVWEAEGNPASPGYRITYVSHQIEELFGYPRADWLSDPKLIWGTIHPEDAARVQAETRAAFARNRSALSQFRILTRDGREVDVEMRASVLHDAHGAPAGIRGITMDISERRRSEELLREAEKRLLQAQKMEAVGRVAGGLAHDFNNLLTTVNGYSDLILHAPPGDASIPDHAREIRAAGTRAADLTLQLLTFSRQDVVQPLVFDLNGLVADRERWLVSLLCDGVHLGLTLAPGPLEVRADPNHIHRILTNLVLNARDAMPHGGVITLSTAYREEIHVDDRFSLAPGPGPHVILGVSDTGVGIPGEMMDRLFEPFFTTKPAKKAMGLGLPAVYGILERSGGGIRVESKVGEGSRFEVYLRAHAPSLSLAGSEGDCSRPGAQGPGE